MQQRPEQPPEGRLIAAALKRTGMSIREASRRAGISYGRWRQITTGVQYVSPGEYAKVHAPAATVARMALVVDITPELMETEGQRPDAAEEMRRPLRAAPAAPVLAHIPDAGPEVDAALKPHTDIIRRYLALASQRHRIPPEQLTGEMVFGADTADATDWDDFRRQSTLPLSVWMLASVWQALQREAAERRRTSGSG